MSVTIPSFYVLASLHRGWLFWFDTCNLIHSASIRGCYMSLSLSTAPAAAVAAGGWKITGRLSRVVFLPSPFKSTLRHASLWPLMHPVHLVRQGCETQDHRHGQKQFHPLTEPISTLHFEAKQESDTRYCTRTIWSTYCCAVSLLSSFLKLGSRICFGY